VPGSTELGIDPARLWLGWGDWNVFVAMPESDFEVARLVGSQLGVEITSIGEFWGTEAGVFLRRGDRTVPAPRLESERFAADSWFAEGIQAYVDRLLAIKIPE
jgi:thiamine-monophosphate kinase